MSDSDTDPTTAFRLDGQCALVTGASSGLGERFARVLSGAGAGVVLTARRSDRIEALARDLPDALALTLDVTAVDAAETLMTAAVDRFGQVDVLVNNAGISQITPALDLTPDEFRRELEIDLVAPYVLARAVAAHVIDVDRLSSRWTRRAGNQLPLVIPSASSLISVRMPSSV